MKLMEEHEVNCRKPIAADGNEVWKLVKRAGGLDVNSVYSYILLCDMFSDTCRIAERNGRLCGFVSGFRKPAEPETLFIWQIAVDPETRGKGIGSMLLRELARPPHDTEIVEYVEATVGPSNEASRQLFIRLAEETGAECSISMHYQASMFPESHDDELLFRIGPMPSAARLSSLQQLEGASK